MRIRTLEDDFVDSLMKDFEIPDRAPLVGAVLAATEAFTNYRLFGKGGNWSNVEADALDALGTPLQETRRLLRIVSRGIAPELARHRKDKSEEELQQQVEKLCDRLDFIAGAVASAPRNRRPPGRPEHAMLRAMAAPLAEYWRGTLGRDFTQDHKNWALGLGEREEPTTAATRFVYSVVEHLAPGAGSGLKTIAREFVSSPG